jgi:hypothetical protein
MAGTLQITAYLLSIPLVVDEIAHLQTGLASTGIVCTEMIRRARCAPIVPAAADVAASTFQAPPQ